MAEIPMEPGREYFLNGPQTPGYYEFPGNVTPNFIRVTEPRSDGRQSIYYGRREDGANHGHTVLGPDGGILYARSRFGGSTFDSGR